MELNNSIPAQQNGSVAVTAKQFQEQTVNSVLKKIEAFQEAGELHLPKGYSPQNALRSAWLVLLETKNRDGKYALETCTMESVANAMLKMVTLGLSVIKKQCDFVMYGNKLSCDMEYAGNILLAKRYGNLKDIKANAVFKSDKFVYEIDPKTGRRRIIEHKQEIENLGETEFRGGYAVMEFNDGTTDVEIMNMSQIKKAWAMGGSKGNSPAHNNFGDQMIHKTVINRACKLLIRSSDDSVLGIDDENEPETKSEKTLAAVNSEIKENANSKTITIEEPTDAVVMSTKTNEGVQEEVEQGTFNGAGF